METFMHYSGAMSDSEFAERLREILSGVGLAKAADIMGLTDQQIRRYRSTDGLPNPKFMAIMRLCDRLGIDPWYLAFGRERQAVEQPHVTVPEGMTAEVLPGEIRLSLLPGYVMLGQSSAEFTDALIEKAVLPALRERGLLPAPGARTESLSDRRELKKLREEIEGLKAGVAAAAQVQAASNRETLAIQATEQGLPRRKRPAKRR